MSNKGILRALCAISLFFVAREAAAVTQVCVQVETKTWLTKTPSPKDSSRESSDSEESPETKSKGPPLPAPESGPESLLRSMRRHLAAPPDTETTDAEAEPSSPEAWDSEADATKPQTDSGSQTQSSGPSTNQSTAASGSNEPPIPFASRASWHQNKPRNASSSDPEQDPHRIDPAAYLRRLVEYYVTHDPGYEAVSSGCQQTLRIELYALKSGWTVFARYSGNAREEKVDSVKLDEFWALAERVTLALLRDVSISDTMNRQNVLRADSDAHIRRVNGSSHFRVGLGTSLRAAYLPTAPNATDPAIEKLRLFAPLSFSAGYRGKFRAWGIDVSARTNIGTTERAVRRSRGGGHAEFVASGGLSLHFLRFAVPNGVNTLYYGAGASFELAGYSLVPAHDGSYSPNRKGVVSGGLNVGLLLGYEFMRTNIPHFFLQGELNLPAYVFVAENSAGRIETYTPGLTVEVGVLF